MTLRQCTVLSRSLLVLNRSVSLNVKYNNGITLTGVNSKLKRWASHFSDVLNREDPGTRMEVTS